jgi:DNA processing protein
MERAELASWLRLLETPDLDLASARRLLSAAGSPQAVFEKPAAAWREVLAPRHLAALGQVPEHLHELIETTWAWLQADSAQQVLVLGDDDYPAALRLTADPPLLLYLKGRRELLAAPMLAMVGSRSPTPQGLNDATAFSRGLSHAGWTIVSGLALGVDGAAHRGALQSKASTIAIVGTGLDQIYPKRHQTLGVEIIDRGLMISEYPLGMPPLAPNFPRRNRIIAGLARGCLVVEAALKSGSLVTARLASEAGREVFAVSGSIDSPQSRGCHALIRQGAKLVTSAADVLDELSAISLARPATPAPAGADKSGQFDRELAQVLERMGYGPVSLDELMNRGGWPAAELSGWLLELEMAGAVARLAGQLFQRQARS